MNRNNQLNDVLCCSLTVVYEVKSLFGLSFVWGDMELFFYLNDFSLRSTFPSFKNI
jgi:hypothetical protein